MTMINVHEPPRSLIPKVLRDQAIHPIDVTRAHALAVADLPSHHRDSLDRLLVVQANPEKLAILSADKLFAAYGVEAIW